MMKGALQLVASALTCLAVPLWANQEPKPDIITSTAVGDHVITHIADGAGWKTTITLVNLADVAVTYHLYLFADSGVPQAFPLASLGNANSITGSLPVGGSANIETSGTSSTVTQGWGAVTASDEVSGFAIFRHIPTEHEAVVPVESWLTGRAILAFDNLNGYFYGVALANPNNTTVQLTVSFKDEQGNQFGSGAITLSPYGHTSFLFADKFPVTINRRGTADFRVVGANLSHTFSGMGLRFNPTGAFTSVHMLSGAFASGYLPQ